VPSWRPSFGSYLGVKKVGRILSICYSRARLANMSKSNQHPFYFELNLIGYGLAKFNYHFTNAFGFTSQRDFCQYCIDIGIAKTIGTVTNRMDMFDPFFPETGRRGWWQKKELNQHRKAFIDALHGQASVNEYADMVKYYLATHPSLRMETVAIEPIARSRYQALQETGLQAEMYFMTHFQQIDALAEGVLSDARCYGDGYDFQIKTHQDTYLVEVKGIRDKQGTFRFTHKEFLTASTYQQNYLLVLVLNLNEAPTFKVIAHPVVELRFNEVIVQAQEIKEYHLAEAIRI
jgi:hypothetical protein